MANELTDIMVKVESIIRSDQNIRIALTTVLAEHKKRIYVEGFDVTGNKIGQYSTKPASITKKNQARNTGKTYFSGGYSEYKKDVGRNPGYVILRNTDQEYNDYGLIGSNGVYGFGFHNQINADKSVWNEDHFSKTIFDLSSYEESLLADVLVDQFNKSL